MKKKWRFRRRVIDRVSPEVKELIQKLLEPDVKKRIPIDNVLTSSWILMDSRLKCNYIVLLDPMVFLFIYVNFDINYFKALNLFELSALRAAKKEEQKITLTSKELWPENSKLSNSSVNDKKEELLVEQSKSNLKSNAIPNNETCSNVTLKPAASKSFVHSKMTIDNF